MYNKVVETKFSTHLRFFVILQSLCMRYVFNLPVKYMDIVLCVCHIKWSEQVEGQVKFHAKTSNQNCTAQPNLHKQPVPLHPLRASKLPKKCTICLRLSCTDENDIETKFWQKAELH